MATLTQVKKIKLRSSALDAAVKERDKKMAHNRRHSRRSNNWFREKPYVRTASAGDVNK